MTQLITIFGFLFVAYVLVECINMIMLGRSLVCGAIGICRRIVHRSKEVALPEDLKIAAANGLLAVGSEVVVGDGHLWDGSAVKRFAVAPSMVDAEPGVVMKIMHISRDHMELKPLAEEDSTPTMAN